MAVAVPARWLAAEWTCHNLASRRKGLPAQQFDAAPYAQIVRSLFARTRRVVLYGPDGRLWWSEDGADALD